MEQRFYEVHTNMIGHTVTHLLLTYTPPPSLSILLSPHSLSILLFSHFLSFSIKERYRKNLPLIETLSKGERGPFTGAESVKKDGDGSDIRCFCISIIRPDIHFSLVRISNSVSCLAGNPVSGQIFGVLSGIRRISGVQTAWNQDRISGKFDLR